MVLNLITLVRIFLSILCSFCFAKRFSQFLFFNWPNVCTDLVGLDYCFPLLENLCIRMTVAYSMQSISSSQPQSPSRM